MANSIQSIALDKLAAHPDNANQMSEVNFGKLVRNIERSSRYEPLIVRPSPEREGFFQIINGEHRYRALAKLGYKTADCIVWDVDDEQTDVLLSTLNRLAGTDRVSKKLKVLIRLRSKTAAKELARFLPQSAKQMERLINLRRPIWPAQMNGGGFASPLVFFADDGQKKIIEEAISQAYEKDVDSCSLGDKFRRNDKKSPFRRLLNGKLEADECRPLEGRDEKECGDTKAGMRAAALVRIAKYFIKTSKGDSGI